MWTFLLKYSRSKASIHRQKKPIWCQKIDLGLLSSLTFWSHCFLLLYRLSLSSIRKSRSFQEPVVLWCTFLLHFIHPFRWISHAPFFKRTRPDTMWMGHHFDSNRKLLFSPSVPRLQYHIMHFSDRKIITEFHGIAQQSRPTKLIFVDFCVSAANSHFCINKYQYHIILLFLHFTF